MSDQLSEKFKQVFEQNFPDYLHGRIMDGINFFRLKKIFWSAFFLMSVNFLVTGFFFLRRLIDNDALSVINFMIREFETSLSYFGQFAGLIYDIFPLGLFVAILLNIVLIIYLKKIYFLFKKSEGRSFLKQGVIRS